MTFIAGSNGYDAVVSSREALIAQGTLLSNVITINNKKLLVRGTISLNSGESIVLDGPCVLQGAGYVFGGGSINYVSGGFAGAMITTNSNSFGTLISGLRLSNPSTNALAVCIRMGNTHRVENCGIAAVTAIEISGNCFVINNYINPSSFSGPGFASALNAFKFISVASALCENNRISGNIIDLGSGNASGNFNSFLIDSGVISSKITKINISNNLLAGTYGIRGDSQIIEECNISDNTMKYVGTTSNGCLIRCPNLTGSVINGNTVVNEAGLQSYFIDTISNSLNVALGNGGRIIGNAVKAPSSGFTHSFSTQSFTNTSTNCRVRGNLFTNTSGTAVAYTDSTLA